MSQLEQTIASVAEIGRAEFKKKNQKHVRIIVTGGSRIGKSTLLNELYGAAIAETAAGPPCTKCIREYPSVEEQEDYDGPLLLIDTRGFEAERTLWPTKSITGDIRKHILARQNNTDCAEHVHMAILCLNGTTRGFTPIDQDMAKIFTELGIPTIIALTWSHSGTADEKQEFIETIERAFIAVDRKILINTVHSAFPSNAVLKARVIELIENFRNLKGYQLNGNDRSKIFDWPVLRSIIQQHVPRPSEWQPSLCKQYDTFFDSMDKKCLRATIVPLLARRVNVGDIWIESFGLDVLNEAAMRYLDEAYRNAYAAGQRLISIKLKRANICLGGFTALAGIVGAVPIPLASTAMLVPLEGLMMVAVTKTFNLKIKSKVLKDTAQMVLSSGIGGTAGSLGALAGRTILANVLKSIPGVGTVAGAVVGSVTAVAFTQAFGQAFIGALTIIMQTRRNNDPPPSTDDLLKAMQQHFEEKSALLPVEDQNTSDSTMSSNHQEIQSSLQKLPM